MLQLPAKRLSQIAESLLWLDGRPFSFADYPMQRAIYDGRFKSTLMMCGRQIGKSTSLANFIIAESVAIPFFREYYVSPTKEQTLIFSNTRVGKTLAYSPLVRKHFQSPEHADRVLHRAYTNGSENAFTYAQEDADRARGFSADRCCYAKGTQVLTARGWAAVEAVRADDILADVDSAGEIEWHRPSALIHEEYTGTMIEFKHRGFFLRVTGNHRMWANLKVKPQLQVPDDYSFMSAEELISTERMGFKLTSQTTPRYSVPPETRTFDGVPGTHITVKYQPFAQLVGWYISEGSLAWRTWQGNRTHPNPVITQTPGRYLKQIEELADAAGIPHFTNGPYRTRTAADVHLNSVALGRYFEPLGKSFDKFIPREFFEHASLLTEVLKGIYLGDACYHAGEPWDTGTLRTRSKQLAEDVQEAWFRLGRACTVYVREMTGKPLYEIRPCKYTEMIFWRADFTTKNRVTAHAVVAEDVYCFTVPHHRLVVKGGLESKPIICGNSFDEFQDMLSDAVVPVVTASMKNSQYRYETYTGTPKTMENPIQVYWEKSTQSEWVMKCDGCSKYNYVISEKAIGKRGPICLHCGKTLNPRGGIWVDMRKPEPPPNWDPTSGVEFRYIKGFHIPSPIMPLNIPGCHNDPESQRAAQERWNDILTDMENFGPSKFRNEVLGVSDAIGRRLISLEELKALCVGPSIQRKPDQRGNLKDVSVTVAGVDWSGGGTSGVSRTVLWVWGWMPKTQKLRTLYYRIYPGNNPVNDVRDILEILQMYNVAVVVGDAGEGALPNSMLRDGLGPHRCTMVQYGSQQVPCKWNGLDRYNADRTTLIDNFLMVLKKQGVEYPPYEEMVDPIKDILNIYEEVTTMGKKVWRHSPTLPDDSLHAQLFGWFAFKLHTTDLRFYA